MLWDGPSDAEIVAFAMIAYLSAGSIPHLITSLLTSWMFSAIVLRKVQSPKQNIRFGTSVGLQVGGVSLAAVLAWLLLCVPIAAFFPSGSEDYWGVIFGGWLLIALLALSALLWFPLKERYPTSVARRNLAAVMAAIILIPSIWIGWTATMVYVFHLDDGHGYGGPMGWQSTEVMVWWVISIVGVLIAGVWVARKSCHTAPYISNAQQPT